MWPITGTSGELAGGRLVHRREVVEVEDVGVGGSRLVELARPRVDLELEALVVEAGEDGVLGSRPVLEGRVHGRRIRALECGRPLRGERRRVVDDVEVLGAVEPLGLRARSDVVSRPRHHRHLDVGSPELAGQRPCRVC